MALCLLLTAAACAPTVQTAGRPGPQFVGPKLEEKAVVSFDGARLGLSSWKPREQEPWAVIVGLHGMNDHSGAFWMAGPWWAERGIATYAYDQRGFGRSPGRGVWGGERLMTEDLRTVVALVRARHPNAVIAVAGESMGGAVAISAFASDRPPAADRVVLLAPAIWGWGAQPYFNRVALWFAAHTFGGRRVDPPRVITRRIYASDNIPELRRMGRDPLMIWSTRPDTVYGLVSLMESARRRLPRVRVPTAYFYGARDRIIPQAPSLAAAASAGPNVRSAYYAEGWHILLRDYQAEVVWRDVEAFLRDPSAPFPSGAPPIPRPGMAAELASAGQ